MRCDNLRDALEVRQNLIVPKAQHSITLAFKEPRAAIISGAVGVLTAVRLNDQPTLLAHEIGNERTDRLLSTKLGSAHLTIAQHGPELALRIRQFVA